MPDFHKSRATRAVGRKPFGNKGGFDRGPRQSFKANCAKCGEVCEVPFRPNGVKPVYCNNCFVKDDSARPPRKDFSSNGPRRDFSPRPSFRNDRPERSEAPMPRPDHSLNEVKAELRNINEKLGQLIGLMTTAAPKAAPEKAPKVKAVKKAVAKKKKK